MIPYLEYSYISRLESRKSGLFQWQFRSVRPARPTGEKSRPATAGLVPPWLRHCRGPIREQKELAEAFEDFFTPLIQTT